MFWSIKFCVPLFIQTTASKHGSLEWGKQPCCDRVRSTHRALQDTGVRPWPSVCVIAISARFHRPVHLFIIIGIEMSACTQSSALVVVLIELRATAWCYFFVRWLDDGAKGASIEVVHSNPRRQHTRRRRRSGLATAELLLPFVYIRYTDFKLPISTLW